MPPLSFSLYKRESTLRHQLNNTASIGNLLLGQLAHPACADNQGNLGEAALAEDLGVAEGKEVEDGDGVLLLAGNVGLAGLGGDEGPELFNLVSDPMSAARMCVSVGRTLSRLMTGFQKWFFCLWKYLIPTLPK